MRPRPSPRTSGVLGMIGSVGIAVGAGFLIVNAPTSILGAFVLVAATILYGVSFGWLFRRDWQRHTVPEMDYLLTRKKAMRAVIVQSTLTPLMIGSAVWLVATGYFFSAIYIPLALANLYVAIQSLRGITRTEKV